MLTIVACGAPAARHVGELAQLAIDAGWSVSVVASPAGLTFLDPHELQHITGHPVYTEYRKPDETRHRGLPEPTAMIVAPATFNTINKIAAGITDTYALGLISDAIGNRLPIVVVPFVNAMLATRIPFQRSLAGLRDEGVEILYGEEHGRPAHPAGTGETQPLPWRLALTALASHPRRRQSEDREPPH